MESPCVYAGEDVNLTAGGTLNVSEGFIETSNGGDIALEADGDITATYSNLFSQSRSVDAGNITLDSRNGSIDAFESLVFAFADGGNGGTVTVTAADDVTIGEIDTGSFDFDGLGTTGGEITIESGGSIDTTSGDIFSSAYSLGGLATGGNITLMAENDITTRSLDVSTEDAFGVNPIVAGNISLRSNNGSIEIQDNIQATAVGSGSGGNVSLDARDNITIDAHIDVNGSEVGGNITLTSTGDDGTIDTRGGILSTFAVEDEGIDARAGHVILSARGDVLTNGINSQAGIQGGDIQVTSRHGSIDSSVGNLVTQSPHGTAGNVTLNANGDVTTRTIASDGQLGGGNLRITSTNGGINTSGGSLVTMSEDGNAGDVTLQSHNNITTAHIRSSSQTGDGGHLRIRSTHGNIATGNLQTFTNSNGAGGQIDLSSNTTATSSITTGDVSTHSSHGRGGDINVTAYSNIQTHDIQTFGRLDSGGIAIEILDSGDLTTGHITTETTAGVSGRITINGTNVETANVQSIGSTGSGDITILAEDGITTQTISTTTETGDSGDINTTSGGNTNTGDITTATETGDSGDINTTSGGNTNTGNLTTATETGDSGDIQAALHDKTQFLVEKYGLSIIPSMGLLDLNYISVQNAQVLAMGASEFSHQSPLPAVPAELSLITGYWEILRGESTAKDTAIPRPKSGLWKGRSFLNETFTLENLQTQSQQQSFGILHLATHAQFQPGTPENSYIQFWDKPLQLDRFSELGLEDSSFELLVLSACRTALGDRSTELGFAGLAVQAGSQSALASLWYVSDDGTLALMSEFYSHLDRVKVKTEALRQAQIAMIREQVYLHQDKLYFSEANEGLVLPENLVRSGRHSLSHPYYWSSFTTIGNPW